MGKNYGCVADTLGRVVFLLTRYVEELLIQNNFKTSWVLTSKISLYETASLELFTAVINGLMVECINQ